MMCQYINSCIVFQGRIIHSTCVDLIKIIKKNKEVKRKYAVDDGYTCEHPRGGNWKEKKPNYRSCLQEFYPK